MLVSGAPMEESPMQQPPTPVNPPTRVLMKDGRAFVQTGAGIVADSQPSREFQETLNKAAGMLKALEVAQRGGAR